MRMSETNIYIYIYHGITDLDTAVVLNTMVWWTSRTFVREIKYFMYLRPYVCAVSLPTAQRRKTLVHNRKIIFPIGIVVSLCTCCTQSTPQEIYAFCVCAVCIKAQVYQPDDTYIYDDFLFSRIRKTYALLAK